MLKSMPAPRPVTVEPNENDPELPPATTTLPTSAVKREFPSDQQQLDVDAMAAERKFPVAE